MPWRLIVVGASLGGVSALSELVADLPANFAAPILVVLHTGSHTSLLPEILRSKGVLPAAHAVDGETLAPGRIYIARPDRHLEAEEGKLRVTFGPKEHHTRPAIDPLFMSAALAYGRAVIGVILTGTLEDGTAGLQAIKARGGIAIVQNPADALAPEMPESAMRYVAVDHSVALAGMGKLLTDLARAPISPEPAVPAPAWIFHEMQLHRGEGKAMEHLEAIGHPSAFVCPDCKGGLWEIDGTQPVRYRCHTGHAFTLSTLQRALTETMDEALWTALRALQEQTVLLALLAIAHRKSGAIKEAMQLDMVRERIDVQRSQLSTLVKHPPGVSAAA